MRLRRRLRELEERVAALERPDVDYAMPPRPAIGGDPVEAQVLWRERCAEYGEVRMEDVPDDRFGVYI